MIWPMLRVLAKKSSARGSAYGKSQNAVQLSLLMIGASIYRTDNFGYWRIRSPDTNLNDFNAMSWILLSLKSIRLTTAYKVVDFFD